MVAGLAVPGGRPHLTRSRSHTSPSSSAVPQQPEEAHEAPATSTGPRSPPRPSHGRSHSYISPVDPKPRNANTLPAEPSKHTHTLRLPGTHREHKHHLRHRHTQSEAKHSKHESADSLPHLVARLQKEKTAAEKQQNTNLSRQGTNTSSSTWQSHMNNLVRIASTDPYRNLNPANEYPSTFGAAYHRAWDGSGTSIRQPTTKPQTWLELAVDRAAAKKELELRTPKPADVERRQAELALAQEELRSRLADVGRQSAEIGRRLEYTYYSLLEKLGSLVGTIQSFQSLSEQTRQLISNFETETGKLDADTRRRVEKMRGGFEERDERVKDLEERSEKAGTKAKGLQTRLAEVRTMVEEWEAREDQAVKTWWRVWGMVFWGSVVLSILVISLVVYKEGWIHRDPGLVGLGASPAVVDTTPGNHSLAMDVPEEVRVVLDGIEERRKGSGLGVLTPMKGRVEVVDEGVERRRDARLRVLDEL